MCDIDKSKVEGFPPHGQVQKIRRNYYVFFAYCFAVHNKRKQERDYLGKVDPVNMTFQPNPYYLLHHPDFFERPLWRWRDPEKRERERRKIPPVSPVIEPLGHCNKADLDSAIKNPAEPDINKGIPAGDSNGVESTPLRGGLKEVKPIEDPGSGGDVGVEVANADINNEIANGNSNELEQEPNPTTCHDGQRKIDVHEDGLVNPPVQSDLLKPLRPDLTALPLQLPPSVLRTEPANADNVRDHCKQIAGETDMAINNGEDCGIQNSSDMKSSAMKSVVASNDSLELPQGSVEVVDFVPAYRYVGATAVCLMLLEQTGMIADLGNSVFHGDVIPTMNVLNLALHAAVTSKPTYLAGPESLVLQFIGPGCLKSPRASEFFQKIGSAGEDAMSLLSQARVARLGKGHLLSLDGTCVDCPSKKISLSQVGKKKDGTFGPQINLSVLMDTSVGSVVAMKPYAGNLHDVMTIDDYLNLWDSFGVNEKDSILTLDRAFGGAGTFVKLDLKGVRYIIGLKTALAQILKIIQENKKQFRLRSALLGHHDCYGLKFPLTFKFGDNSADIDGFIYRNPDTEMKETHEFLDKLHKFEGQWEAGKCDMENPLRHYYVNPVPGLPLRRNEEKIDDKCATFGFYALASNVPGLSKDGALTKYDMRGDVETVFGLMFEHLFGPTRVHSTPALKGLLLTVFTGLDILTTLRTRMKLWMPIKPKSQNLPSQVRDLHSIASLLHQFNHISLQRYSNGNIALLNVTSKDKELAAAIGLEGLFDSAQRIHDLFTVRHLEEVIRKG